MIGYMDEMCSDWYDPKYYANSARVSPTGPGNAVEDDARVTRGGMEHAYKGFFNNSNFFGVLPAGYLPFGWSRDFCHKASVEPKHSSHVSGRLGFRVVVSPGHSD